MELNDSVALVTGANRGLGREVVQSLLRTGVRKVYAAARDTKAMTWITDPRVVQIKIDVTSGDDVAAAAVTCTDVNVLINNAGVMNGVAALAEAAKDALRHEFEVNVIGLQSMVSAFAPVLARNGGGAIANMLSVVSWYVYPFNATYCASKHAALALTDGMRMQLREKGISVTGVYAGFIDTDMAAHVSGPKALPRDVAASMLEGIRLGRDHVCADPYAQSVFQTMFNDPGSVERAMQAAWDSGQAWSA